MDTYGDTDRRWDLRAGGEILPQQNILRYLNGCVIIFFNQLTLNISSREPSNNVAVSFLKQHLKNTSSFFHLFCKKKTKKMFLSGSE